MRWRLISANGRELGRSAESFGSRDEAELAVGCLAHTARAGAVRVAGAGDRGWVWELVVDGDVVVRASHSFDRRIRCEQAASLFLQLVGEAELRPGIIEPAARRPQRSVRARGVEVHDLALELRDVTTALIALEAHG